MAVATTAREGVRDDIVRIVHRGLGVPELAGAVARALGRAVPFDGTCLLTIDPATLLPTGEVVENALPADARARLGEIEMSEPDYNKFAALARAPQPAASLSDVTAGDLDRSVRQREVRRPHGFEDELRVVCADAMGTCGALTLLRETASPHFTPAEVRFVASLAGLLAGGLRQAALLGATATDRGGNGDGDGGDAGLLVLAADDTVELSNRAADGWLDELAPGDQRLPVVVHAVAQRARQAATGAGPAAQARVRTPTGHWLLVRGSLLRDGTDGPATGGTHGASAGTDDALGSGARGRVAVVLEPARPPELAPLIADAYGFTDRERRVTELVARGLSTSEIAGRLHLSAYTVQDHLKSIFEKSGTGSRGDLVARLFFDHYAPRLSAGASSPPARHRGGTDDGRSVAGR